MTKDRTAVNFTRLVTSIIFIAMVLVICFYIFQSCGDANSASKGRAQKEFRRSYPVESWNQYDCLQLIQARLVRLANKGCEAPFKDCLYARDVEWYILDLMDRDNIPFGTSGLMSQDRINQLVDMAEGRIASQKLTYLKMHGGVKFASDIDLLRDVCYQVYERRGLVLGGNPTEAELKQLLPAGVTKVRWCAWKDN
jgi:hypothetical protein